MIERRIPAIFLNGAQVALGIGCIQLVMSGLGGPHAAQLALSGAVCTSLADVPTTVARTGHRVTAAAALSFLAALAAGLLKPYPLALGGGIALIAFLAMMTMAWGPRAGAVSFAPILALVFAMALPAGGDVAVNAAWNAAGAAAYIVWSLLAGRLLQPRYRALALSGALAAAASLLRLRAALLATVPGDAAHADAMQAWVAGEAALAERLQTARDFIFAQPDTARARRDTAILLRAIDLRDVLLASRLDVELLGGDASGRRILGQVAAGLRQVAAQLDAAALALRDGRAAAAVAAHGLALDADLARASMACDDPRARLIPALSDRLHSLVDDASRILTLLNGGLDAPDELPLTRAQLQRFVAPEGWPLRALAAQWHGRSPVLRHAVRSALALSCAYFIALALPWASHPHWLVLSVAVVLRGSLEQTLSRRNARVLGTLLGCAGVVALSRSDSPPLLAAVFLLSVGIAHSFVMQRYWLTATAATVMALLQSHMVNPGTGFAVGERVADTLFGAVLAWGFSYVLPSWERRSLPDTIARLLRELGDYASHALQLRTPDELAQRLARRQAYDTLGALAAALQRSAAEPQAVQVPAAAVAALLDHGQRLMAHLSVVRMALSQHGDELAAPAAQQALATTRESLTAILCSPAAAGPQAADPAEPVAETGPDRPDDLSRLPRESPADAALPWLLRRLDLLVHDARQIRRAAAGARVRPRDVAVKPPGSAPQVL